jgi:uncharacterized protein YbjT (DUF2867 family)
MRRAVLVTGAGGKTGAAVLAALRARGARTVGLVRSDHHPAPAADEVVVGDQRDPAVLDRAMADVEAVYAVAPNLSPDELGMASAVVAACERAGVRRLVLHSVVHPQLRTMPHHADKARAEEVVVTSGLAWTVLQPNAYLQNLAAYVPGMREGVLRVPYAVDRVLASVDLADVAAVAARVLLEDVGVHGTFELSGPAEDTPIDVGRDRVRPARTSGARRARRSGGLRRDARRRPGHGRGPEPSAARDAPALRPAWLARRRDRAPWAARARAARPAGGARRAPRPGARRHRPHGSTRQVRTGSVRHYLTTRVLAGRGTVRASAASPGGT